MKLFVAFAMVLTKERTMLRCTSHSYLRISQGKSRSSRLNGAAMLGFLSLLLSPQVVFGAEIAENYIDPYERARQSWESKTPLSSTAIKGRRVSVGDRFWQVAILNSSIPDPLYAHFCSGALVTSHWVVTSARCVANRQAAELTVLTGTDSLNFGGQNKKVLSIIVHASYNPRTFENDLALLYLDTPTVNSQNTRPQFPSVEFEQQLIDGHEKIKIAGWGNTYDFGVKSLDLREAEAPLVPSQLCTAPDSQGPLVKATMLCAGYEDERTNACDGDSGGPATVRNYGSEYLIGVMSWGECGAPKKYGVFTRIAPYVGWIRANLASIRSGTRYYFR
ncbi:MAG: serine protease [Nitrosospira sp.]